MGFLAGRSIAVVRDEVSAHETAEQFRARGAVVHVAPLSTFEAIAVRLPKVRFDWVLYTSQTTVRFFAQPLPATKVFALGERTAAALTKVGIRVDAQARESRAEGVVTALLPLLYPHSRVLYPRAEKAREVIAPALTEAGHSCFVVPVYRNVPASGEALASVQKAVEDSEFVLVTAGSVIDHLVTSLGTFGLTDKKLVSIGPVTSEAIEKQGLPVFFEASTPNIEDLAMELDLRTC